jgi:phage baseplate assembly protein W
MARRFDHPFHPEIYSPIQDLLFELLTNDVLANIKRAVEYIVTNFEPRVEIIKVDVVPFAEKTGVDVTIYFKIIGTEETLKTTISLDRIL